MTVGQALALASEQGIAALDAEVLLGHVAGKDRAWLLAFREHELEDEQAEAFRALLVRRATGEPVAYLTGQREFYSLDFAVSPAVLIPRPETEHIVDAVLEWAVGRPPLTLVDVGTGSGALAVALAVNLPDAFVYATDLSSDALAVAEYNVMAHGVAVRVTLLPGDLLDPLLPGVRPDVIVSNPPYIASPELATLEVARHEPLLALDGGPDGLDVLRRLLAQIAGLPVLPGLTLVEIGAEQGAEALRLARDVFPKAKSSIMQDYAGLDRVLRLSP